MKSFIPVLFLFLSCKPATNPDLSFFIGTWYDGNNSYEVWEKSGNGLEGYGYTLSDSIKKISEYLRMYKYKGDLMYEATVPDQNNGKPVSFKLTSSDFSTFIFENPNHDFPTTIKYSRYADTLWVEVSGSQRSLSLKMVKQ